MKALKWLGILVGSLIGLVVVAAIVVPLVVDVDKYRPQIVEAANQQTQRQSRARQAHSFALGPGPRPGGWHQRQGRYRPLHSFRQGCLFPSSFSDGAQRLARDDFQNGKAASQRDQGQERQDERHGAHEDRRHSGCRHSASRGAHGHDLCRADEASGDRDPCASGRRDDRCARRLH